MIITRERCRLMYDLLAECPPFIDWNMPDSDDVIFKVTNSKDTMGYHKLWMRGRAKDSHEIGISRACCGWIGTFTRVMAHEMLHLHQEERGMGSPHTMHNAAFLAEAKVVCNHLGFDPHMFV